MQMYHVKYVTHYEHAVEKGDVIVCAESHDAAGKMVVHELSLPTSRTQCDTTRIKPSLYVLEKKQLPTEGNKAPRGNSHISRQPLPQQRFHFTVEGDVSAGDDRMALKRLSEAVTNKIEGRGSGKHASHVVIDCKPKGDYIDKVRGLDAIALYRQKPTQGGDVSGD